MIEVLTGGGYTSGLRRALEFAVAGRGVGTAGSERLLFIVYPLEYAPILAVRTVCPQVFDAFTGNTVRLSAR